MASSGRRDSTPARRRLDREKHGEEGDNLNSELWGELPEPLVEGILAKLPFSSLLRFCSVCKTWRELILHADVFPRCASDSACLVCFDGDSKLTAFSPSRGCWENVPLQFPQVDWSGRENVFMSAGGLLCFRIGGLLNLHTDEDSEYIVCNPLTKCGKRLQLPCTKERRVPDRPRQLSERWIRVLLDASLLVGMVVDCHTGHFKLVVGSFFPDDDGRTLSAGTTLVYDSNADSWNKAADIPKGVLRDVVPKAQPTTCICKGNLYFYFKHIFGSNEDRLLKYEVKEEAWSWILMPKYKRNRYVEKSRNIMERNGEILLVTPTYVFREMDQTIQMTFQVQKLQDHEGSTRWLRTSYLPFSRVREDMPVGTQIDYLGHGDVMYFIRRNVNRSLPPKKISVKTWFHDVATNSDVISEWVDYQGDRESTDFQIFMPSTVLLK